jgi:hypothetical protein
MKSREYLDKKLIIKANFQGLKQPRDLPSDHAFGIPPSNSNNDLAGTIANKYAASEL